MAQDHGQDQQSEPNEAAHVHAPLTRPLRGAKYAIFTIWVFLAVIGALGFNDQFQKRLRNFMGGILTDAFRPELLFGVGVGLIALIAFFALLTRSDTLRLPIAASLTLIFIAFLVLPRDFSHAVPERFVGVLIRAFTAIIGFYFASEATVQVAQSVQQRKLAAEMDGTQGNPAEIVHAPGDASTLIGSVSRPGKRASVVSTSFGRFFKWARRGSDRQATSASRE